MAQKNSNDPVIEQILADPIPSETPPPLTTKSLAHNPEQIDQQLVGVFLYTEFQKRLQQASQIIKKGPPSEELPFNHFYDARKVLHSLLQELKKHLALKGPTDCMVKDVKSIISNSSGSNDVKLTDLSLSQESSQSPLLPEWASTLPIAGRLSLAIILYNLGQNYSDSEENTQALQHLIRSLQILNTLSNQIKFSHLNLIQKLYNTLGIIHCNKQVPEKGIPYFSKAQFVYTLAKDQPNPTKFTNSFKKFLKQRNNDDDDDDIDATINSNKENISQQLKEEQHSKVQFSFIIDGGINTQQLQHNFTLTAFFLTQAYTQTNQRDKAITYCAITLKRQLQSGQFELKQWCHNAMQLSDYFLNHNHYAQAEYCLFAGMTLLPTNNQTTSVNNTSSASDDQQQTKHNVTATSSIGTGRVQFPDDLTQLKAEFDMQLGRYYMALLKLAIDHYPKTTTEGQQQEKQFNPEFHSKLHQQFIVFQKSLPSLKWPKIQRVTTQKQAEKLFRLANTRFKNSLKYYVINGFVTEHVELQRHISEIYQLLSEIQNDPKMQYAMHQRRLGIVQPLLQSLNKKVYQNFYIILHNDVSEITQSLFDLQMEQIMGEGNTNDQSKNDTKKKQKKKKKKMKPSAIRALNQLGLKSISSSEELLRVYDQVMNRQREEGKTQLKADVKKEYAQTLINLHFKAARVYTKLLPSSQKDDEAEQNIKMQVKALNHYTEIIEFVESFKNEDKRLLDKSIWSQYQQCKEMAELLPIKIQKMKTLQFEGGSGSVDNRITF